jgi:general secretion pathway protein J
MSERGFTLVELVVALFVFALLATAGTALLSVSIKSQQAVTASLAKGAESGRIVSLLSTDLAQAASRPLRNRDGAVQPAFVGRDGGRDGVFLAYVRNGNAGVQRNGGARDAS